jgi:hypothetical protein
MSVKGRQVAKKTSNYKSKIHAGLEAAPPMLAIQLKVPDTHPLPTGQQPTVKGGLVVRAVPQAPGALE